MTETTSRVTPRAPEFRMASGLFQSLRQDLITDAFAYRPLSPMRTDGPVTRRLPERIRPSLAHLPHAVVGLLAFLVVMLTSTSTDEFVAPSNSLVMGLIAATPVLMTLVRPVGAFWAAGPPPGCSRWSAPATTCGPGRRVPSPPSSSR